MRGHDNLTNFLDFFFDLGQEFWIWTRIFQNWLMDRLRRLLRGCVTIFIMLRFLTQHTSNNLENLISCVKEIPRSLRSLQWPLKALKGQNCLKIAFTDIWHLFYFWNPRPNWSPKSWREQVWTLVQLQICDKYTNINHTCDAKVLKFGKFGKGWKLCSSHKILQWKFHGWNSTWWRNPWPLFWSWFCSCHQCNLKVVKDNLKLNCKVMIVQNCFQNIFQICNLKVA